ncbi:hypothetical protein E2562_006785 [Oryza meyeriana var. granulata]|uniref:Reverse transcriptase/retrotransposon-derived protein RNase H-like domain-containing protein n=1 Tax=Oryza meyeriana var. granulata TaxID=110450 RepID=A0A6G1C694_9ORYZ|nr:hypothetical protein E2562_006785 [Oryza meyeriana var. granulata]
MRKVKVKLNPEKCVFSIRAGKLMGFLVSKRGIEANPEKIEVIQQMQPPKNARKVQRLTGCIAALNRFMAKSVEKALPFIKTLRGASKFEWTSEYQAAFESLKAYLQETRRNLNPHFARRNRHPLRRKAAVPHNRQYNGV